MSTPVRRVIVDARPVDHPTARSRGIARYTTGLLGGLVEIGAPVTALYDRAREAELLSAAVPDLSLRRWSRRAVRDLTGEGTWYLATQLLLQPIPLDPIPQVVTEARLPVAAVLYDVIPYRHPEVYQVAPEARAKLELRAPLARTTDVLLAISEFSALTGAHELAYPADRVRAIGAGVDAHFAPASERPTERPDRVLPPEIGSFVVAVTGDDERKNTVGLLRAWGRVDARTRADHRLVIANAHTPELLAQWQAEAEAAGVGDGVVFTGFVTDDELVGLLQRARLSVMPSLDEGFGLPVLEAAACGCAVICSATTSLPEVLDEPAATFDPHDPGDIARAIERALVDGSHRDRLLSAGEGAVSRWAWPWVANNVVDALGELGPRWPRPRHTPVRRLAVAGAGLDGLVTELRSSAGWATVTHFVDGSGSAEPASAGIDRLPVRALGHFVKPWDFDDVVAVLDRSGPTETDELLERAPCHVWVRRHWGGPPEVLSAAASVVLEDETLLEPLTHPDGPPVLVADEPVVGDREWAGVLAAWLAEVGGRAPGTIRRLSGRPTP